MLHVTRLLEVRVCAFCFEGYISENCKYPLRISIWKSGYFTENLSIFTGNYTEKLNISTFQCIGAEHVNISTDILNISTEILAEFRFYPDLIP